jgi:DNA-binding response OmpR family regulator
MALFRTPQTGAVPASRGRILLVEDDPDLAFFAAHVLTRHGRFAVTHTPDPATALALVADGSYHLVFADLDLPVMSGLELIAALRRQAPGLPVVLLVPAALSACLTAELRASRPDKVLAKPVPAGDLLAAATALLGDGRADEQPVRPGG